jgi:hypothetical protein
MWSITLPSALLSFTPSPELFNLFEMSATEYWPGANSEPAAKEKMIDGVVSSSSKYMPCIDTVDVPELYSSTHSLPLVGAGRTSLMTT